MTLDFPLSDKFKNYAIEKEIIEKDIPKIFKAFKEYHKEKGESRANWYLSWITWVGNAKKGWGNYNPKQSKRTNDVPKESQRGTEQYIQKETTVNL